MRCGYPSWCGAGADRYPGFQPTIGSGRSQDVRDTGKLPPCACRQGRSGKDELKCRSADKSQAIKNPSSNISKSVRQLNSKHRLILTGTPLENSTLDLWSQMSFVNPGLLGPQSFFKKKYQIPIEKQQSVEHTKKLYNIIKPFILRRHKSQVAKDLPEKVENIYYSKK